MVTPMVSVLTVDDYEPTRYARTRALRALGCRVLEAKDGRTALELAVRERPDILLLDVHLPDFHGFEVCQQLKADPRTADIPVIHVSATGRGDRFRRESAAVGAFAYLQEPVSPDELGSCVSPSMPQEKCETPRRSRGSGPGRFAQGLSPSGPRNRAPSERAP